MALKKSTILPEPLKLLHFFTLNLAVFSALNLWHSRGQRFDPAYLHHREPKKARFDYSSKRAFFVPSIQIDMSHECHLFTSLSHSKHHSLISQARCKPSRFFHAQKEGSLLRLTMRRNF